MVFGHNTLFFRSAALQRVHNHFKIIDAVSVLLADVF